MHLLSGVRLAVVAAVIVSSPLASIAAGQSGRGLAHRMKGDAPRVDPSPRVAQAAPPAAEAVTDYRIQALLSGYRWSTTSLTYSFYSNAVYNGTYYGSESVGEVSEGVKRNVRAIMAWYGSVLNLTFTEVGETSGSYGQIRLMVSSAPGYAYTYYPSGSALGGDVHLNPSYDRLGDTNGFQHPAGEHGYVSLIHEIGHALGLKHPHDAPALPSAEDNFSRTVMTYNFLGDAPATGMAYDLLALYSLYGARALRTGNDVYVVGRAAADQYMLAGTLFVAPSTTTKQAIWDRGGQNTLDLSGVPVTASGLRVDLRPLGWISTKPSYQTTYFDNGLSLGPDAVMRTLVNGSSSEDIISGPEGNVFAGYDPARVTGADVIASADAADTVDLTRYAAGQVTQSVSGNDLVLGLGVNGSIRLVNYYLGAQPQIVYSGAAVDRPPVASATASAYSGTAPLTVQLSSVGSNDPEGGALTYAWSFGSAGSSTAANPSVTFTAAGSYTVTLTVRDAAGLSASSSLTITVAAAPAATMSVRGLGLVAIAGPAGRATVTVLDGNGLPVPGAAVTVQWNGVVKGTGTAVTNAAGVAVLDSKTSRKRGTLSVAVSGLTRSGYTYHAAGNSATTASITLQ